MAETETVEQSTQTVETPQERTFTQSELDDILKARLSKERAKYSDYETLQAKASKFDEMEEASKTELQKATERADALQKQLETMTKENEVRLVREKKAKETGVPAHLLTGETEEECDAQALAILAFKNEAQSTSYPTIKDGGEVSNIPTAPKSNGELFGEFLSQSLKK